MHIIIRWQELRKEKLNHFYLYNARCNLDFRCHFTREMISFKIGWKHVRFTKNFYFTFFPLWIKIKNIYGYNIYGIKLIIQILFNCLENINGADAKFQFSFPRNIKIIFISFMQLPWVLVSCLSLDLMIQPPNPSKLWMLSLHTSFKLSLVYKLVD